MRFRNIFLGIGSLLVILVLIISDPDGGMVQKLPFGSGTLSILISLMVSVLYVGVLHFSRKALWDYLDMEILAKEAMKTPLGSAIIFLGLTVGMLAIAVVVLAATN